MRIYDTKLMHQQKTINWVSQERDEKKAWNLVFTGFISWMYKFLHALKKYFRFSHYGSCIICTLNYLVLLINFFSVANVLVSSMTSLHTCALRALLRNSVTAYYMNIGEMEYIFHVSSTVLTLISKFRIAFETEKSNMIWDIKCTF